MGLFVAIIMCMSYTHAETAVLENQPQIPSNTLRYRKINVTSSNEIVQTEQIYGSTEVICSFHKTVSSFLAMTGLSDRRSLLINHPKLLSYCKQPTASSIIFGIVTWPLKFSFNNLVSSSKLLSCIRSEIPNLSSCLKLAKLAFQAPSRNRREISEKIPITPELLYKSFNSSKCEYKNGGLSCDFSSDYPDLFVPPVVVDTQLGNRNLTQNINLSDTSNPVTIYAPQNFYYYNQPVFIYNSVALMSIPCICILFLLLI